MTTLLEASKEALAALELCRTYRQQDWSSEETTHPRIKQASTALRTAISEAEKVEPVAWATRRGDGGLQLFFLKASAERESFCQMYKTPVLPLFLAAGAQPAPKQEFIQPGYQLVPVEPTDKMVQASLHLDLSYMPLQEGYDRAAVYKAMLAAAPVQAQPAPKQDQCWCDATGIGEPGVSCGDCPKDYAAPVQEQPDHFAIPGKMVQPLTFDQIEDIWIKHGLNECDCHGFARAIAQAHGIGERP